MLSLGIPTYSGSGILEKSCVTCITILSKVRAKDLSRKAKHQELGMVSLGEMINEWAGHDLMHTVQVERAMMQVFTLIQR